MKMSRSVFLLLATAAAAPAAQPPSQPDVWNATDAPDTHTPVTSMPPYMGTLPPPSPAPVQTPLPSIWSLEPSPPTPDPFVIHSGEEHRIIVVTREHAPGPDGAVYVTFTEQASLELQELTASDVYVILMVPAPPGEHPVVSVRYLNLRNATVEVRYGGIEAPPCNKGGLRIGIVAALFDGVSLVGLHLEVAKGAALSLNALQTVRVGRHVCEGVPPIQAEGQVTVHHGVRLRPHYDAWPGGLPVLLKVDGPGALNFIGPGSPPYAPWRGTDAHGMLRPEELIGKAEMGESDMCEWWRRRGSAARLSTGGDEVASVQLGEVRLDGQVSATLTQGAEVLLDALSVHGNTSEAVVVIRDGSSLSVARATMSSTWFETKGGALVFGALATETGQWATFQHDVFIIEALWSTDSGPHSFPGPLNPTEPALDDSGGGGGFEENAVAFCSIVDVADADVRIEAVRLADLDYLSPSRRLFLPVIPDTLRARRMARVVFGHAADVSVANGAFRIGPSWRTELLRGSLRLRQAEGWFKGPVMWALDGFRLFSDDDGSSEKGLLLEGDVFMAGRSILTPAPAATDATPPAFAAVEPNLTAWVAEAEKAAAHGVSVLFRNGTPTAGTTHVVVGSLESFGGGGGGGGSGESGESGASSDGRPIPSGYAVFPYRVVADGVEVKVVGSVAFTHGGLWTAGTLGGSALSPDEPPAGPGHGGGVSFGVPLQPTGHHPDPDLPPADGSLYHPPLKTGGGGGGRSRKTRNGTLPQEEGNETTGHPSLEYPPGPSARVNFGGMHRMACGGVGAGGWCQLTGGGLAGSEFTEVGVMPGGYLRLGMGVEVWTQKCDVSHNAVLHAEGCGTAADLGGTLSVSSGGTLAINQSDVSFGAGGGFRVGEFLLDGRYVAFLHPDGGGDVGGDQCEVPLYAEGIEASHAAVMECGAPVFLRHATVHIALLAESHGIRDIPREHGMRHPVNCTFPESREVSTATLVTSGDGLYYLLLSAEREWLWVLLGTGLVAPALTWAALAVAFRFGGGGGALSFTESLLAQPPIHVRLTFEEARYFLPNFVVGAVIITESFFLTTVAFHPALRWPHASADAQRRLSDVVHLGGLEGSAFQGVFIAVVVSIGVWGLLWSPLLPRPCVREREGGNRNVDVESPAGAGEPSQTGAAAATRSDYCCGRLLGSPGTTHVFLLVHRLLCALGNFFFIPLQLVLLGTFDCPYSPAAGDYVSRFDGELCSGARDVRVVGAVASVILSVAVFHSGSNATSPFGHPPFRSDLDIRHKRTFEACRVALLQLQVLLLSLLAHDPTALAASSLATQAAYLAVTCLCYPCGYYNINRARGLLQSFGPVGLAVALWTSARAEPASECEAVSMVRYVVLALLCTACVAVAAYVARRPPGGAGDSAVIGGVGGGGSRDVGGIGDGRGGGGIGGGRGSRTAAENDECVARLLRVTSTQRQKLRVLRGTIGEMTTREWRGSAGAAGSMPSAGSTDSEEAAARARNAGDMKLQYRKELESYRRFKEAYLVPFYLGLDVESSLTDTWSSSDHSASGTGKEGGDVLALSGSGRDAFDNSAYEGWVRGQLLGRGSFGSVFTGVLRCGALVAVKVVDLHLDEGVKEELGNVQKEVDFLRKLRHPNVIEYKACFVDHEACSIYIFMEYAVGGSLTSLVKKCHEPLSEDVVRGYIVQVVTGLAFLHSHNVIHRDVKGENVLLDAAGRAKLADFGCARDVSAATKNVGTCVGSPYWMAPEVIRNSGYDSKADVWSVGCTTVEALNKGKPPWKEFDSVFAAMYHVTHTDEAPNNKPAGLSPAADLFLDACFNRDPAGRPTAKVWVTRQASKAKRSKKRSKHTHTHTHTHK